jgi:CRP/FNR family transcriptional regulator/CRP/FNR family cyclic AMP-dependent transcriptional regulator
MSKAEYLRPVRQRADAVTDTREWANVLANVPLFRDLSRRHLKKVAGTGRVRRFHDLTAIVRSGEPGDTFYVVLDGEVSVRGRGVTTAKLGMGSFFGEMALLDSGARSATVVANGPVTCLTITRARFLKLLHDEPAIAVAVLKEIAGRLRRAEARS